LWRATARGFIAHAVGWAALPDRPMFLDHQIEILGREPEVRSGSGDIEFAIAWRPARAGPEGCALLPGAGAIRDGGRPPVFLTCQFFSSDVFPGSTASICRAEPTFQ